MKELAFSSLTELSRGLRTKAYTSVELTEHYLDRIARLDDQAHAFVDVYGESALLHARAADCHRRSGMPLPDLHGLPIAIKDVCEIAGRITTCGSSAWRKRESATTSTVVHRLQAAGMILLGKNHMPEFAFGGWGTNAHMGMPRNPWDWNEHHRAPGGSSSGSGVAVAAGLAPASIGSDTGGSARIPASFNGVTGLKTTHGLISLHGVLPMAPSFDSVGTLTRTVDDARALVTAIAGYDPNCPNTHHRPRIDFDPQLSVAISDLRVAVMQAADYPSPVSGDIQAAVDDAARVFRSLGAKVEAVSVPFNFHELMRRSGTIITAEAYHVHSEYIEDPELPFDPWIRKRIVSGKHVSANAYLTEQARRRIAIDAFDAWMNAYDVLLTPTLPFVAPTSEYIDEEISATPFTRPVNYLGACALSMPAGFSVDGLPIGIQLIGKAWHEPLLLTAGRAFQQETNWHLRTPVGLE